MAPAIIKVNSNYYDLKFLETIPDYLKCYSCKNLLNNPQQTNCGIRVCLACINFNFYLNHACSIKYDESCRYFEDVASRKEILNLSICSPLTNHPTKLSDFLNNSVDKKSNDENPFTNEKCMKVANSTFSSIKSENCRNVIENVNATNYVHINGEYILIIDEYLRRYDDKFNPIFGDSFYYNDYKLRLVVYPFGNKNKQYLAIKFHIEQGDKDDILNWPFRNQVKLSILEPIPNETCSSFNRIYSPYSDNFSCFQKPSNCSNDEVGFDEFIKIETVKGKYIVNGKIFIKISVIEGPEQCFDSICNLGL